MIPDNFASFYGDQNRWFIGEVVNVKDDALKMGRVQVRVYGIHTGDENDIPEKELPWAQVMAPITQGGTGNTDNTNGVGNFLGLLPGARVVGFFLDGENSQAPLIMGTIPKYEEASEGGSNINPLAKGEQTYPYDPKGGDCFSEPEDPYAAEYPYNKVYETESGHLKEYDDTPGAERIREKHKSGTFYQMNPDGSYITRVVKDRYSVIIGDDFLKIEGEWKICLDTFTVEAREINMTASESMSLVSDGTMSITSPAGDAVINGVSLVNHTHLDNPGLAAGVTSPPVKE